MTTPRTRRLRLGAASSVAALALVCLSACGDSDAQTASGGTAGTASTAALASKPSPGSAVSAASMTALLKNAFVNASSAHVTLKSSGGTVPLTAVGDASFGDSTAVQMTMTLGSMGKAEVRLVDKTIYLKLPSLGDKYVKIDLDDPSNPLGSTFSDQLDPTKLLSTLKGAITGATYVGSEKISGRTLDHYTVKVDSQKMLANSALPKSSLAQSGLPSTLTEDLWFDADGRPAQVKTDLGQAGSFEATFTKWGEKVDVQAPPSSDVTDMSSLLSPSSSAAAG